METTNYSGELHSPPTYNSRGYEPVKGGIEFQNIPSPQVQSTVVTITPEVPAVRDHIIWSFFNAMYINFCCLGFIALIFSVKARDRKLLRDKHGAISYSSTARSLNIAATALSIVFTIIILVIFIVQMKYLIEVFQAAQKNAENKQKNNFDFGYGYGNGK
ncbi:interferon-induced transmembrane protein 1-like [Rana temporaria]|uniref:interferon-induced transmembrane protein 1-like n=1 Tax=Rana temporaria TaxID=8407 RepID=UPI001AAD859B|nr:interferon-induced transmembrane protein 1-like [Rana temporaria]